jgi:1,2-phenylacetyl-CoA epoxidase PaaB subunit
MLLSSTNQRRAAVPVWGVQEARVGPQQPLHRRLVAMSRRLMDTLRTEIRRKGNQTNRKHRMDITDTVHRVLRN